MISKVINGTEQNVAGNGGGGTNDYEELINLPQINGNELTGNQTGADLGLVDAVTGKGLSTNDYDNTDKAKVGKIDDTTTSATGNPISISGLKTNQLAINPIITLEPIQAGSGDPSPSNVRAISGYDKIEVLSCGKNLFDKSKIISGKALSATNELYESSTLAVSDYILTNSQTDYFAVNVCGTSYVYASVLFYDKSKTFLSYELYEGSKYVEHLITTPQNCAYMRFNIHLDMLDVIQIEKGSDATTYEPYKEVCDIQLTFGQTIYGGSLDVKTGVLTVDRSYKSWKWSDGSSPTNYTNVQRRVFGIGLDYLNDSSKFLNNVTNNLKWDADADIVHYYYESSIFVLFMPLNTDGNTEIQLVYPLGTPYTIQLTPHEISLLKDYAYISTNGSSMSFSYHNGEMASLADVSQLGETVNELGSELTEAIHRNQIDGSVNIPNDNQIHQITQDGYLVVLATVGAYLSFDIISSHSDSSLFTGYVEGGTTYPNSNIIFIQKGMKVRNNGGAGSHSVTFYTIK